jgi:UDP-glucose 4-epimerase
MNSKSILITGANGFLGRHLVPALASRHRVFSVVRTAVDSNNLADNQIFADLSDPNFIEKLPDEIDCVIHLAQSLKYREFPQGVEDMNSINIDATSALLEWSRKTGVKHFIFTSTANVYGASTSKLSESQVACPNSYYGASKLAAELLINQYQQFFKIDVLRCFTIYGPGQKGMLISNIIDRVLSGQPITLAKGFGIHLSLVYVEDVVEILQKLIAIPTKFKNRTMNVCGDELTHLCEIVKIIEKLTGKTANIQITQDKAAHFTGNNACLKEYLEGYRFIDIQSGLERVIHKMELR